ncbi:hypothetical protein EBB07_06030 [Paenibacillaceae bacterium]|nr:hypothetical protein EBB07_06030 [Paenibacillaceae bacterium]
MSFHEMHFQYDGMKSSDMGVCLISTSTGLKERPFFADRELNFELIPNNDTPYYYSTKTQPFRISLQLAPLDGKWTSELKSSVSRWLNNGKFNEFYTTDDINRVYFLMHTGSPTLHTTSSNEGYIQIEFINIDCYARSQERKEIYEVKSNNQATIIETVNVGDAPLYPVLQIQKFGAGDISIRNLHDGGQVFSFTNIDNMEELYVDCQHRYIRTSLMNTYRYDDFSGYYLKLPYGKNRLEVSGKCKLSIAYRYKFLSQ